MNLTITKRGQFTTIKGYDNGCGDAPVGTKVPIQYEVTLALEGELNESDQLFDHTYINHHISWNYDNERNSKSLERLTLDITQRLKTMIESEGATANQIAVKLMPSSVFDAPGDFVAGEYVYTREGWAPPARVEAVEEPKRSSIVNRDERPYADSDDERNHASAEA